MARRTNENNRLISLLASANVVLQPNRNDSPFCSKLSNWPRTGNCYRIIFQNRLDLARSHWVLRGLVKCVRTGRLPVRRMAFCLQIRVMPGDIIVAGDLGGLFVEAKRTRHSVGLAPVHAATVGIQKLTVEP